jgi:hypothetical protein
MYDDFVSFGPGGRRRWLREHGLPSRPPGFPIASLARTDIRGIARTALAERQPRDVLTTIKLVTPGGCLVPLADERDLVSTKSLVLRVARVATGDRQMVTIGPSNPLVGFAIVLWGR